MGERPDFVALHKAIEDGRKAQQALADYYDNLTPEELEEEFEDGDPVKVTTPREGIAVSWQVRFEPSEVDDVCRAAKALDLSVSAYLRHLALLDARGHALTAADVPGTACCPHFSIAPVTEAECPACGPLPISRAMTH